MKKVFVIYSGKMMTSFFYLQFSEVLCIVQKKKQLAYLDPEEILSKKHVLFM